MKRMVRLGFALGLVLIVPSPGRADEPYNDVHKVDPPRENTEWPKKTKRRVKALLDWPASIGEQTSETGESTKGQTRDEKRAKTTPRELPREPY